MIIPPQILTVQEIFHLPLFPAGRVFFVKADEIKACSCACSIVIMFVIHELKQPRTAAGTTGDRLRKKTVPKYISPKCKFSIAEF